MEVCANPRFDWRDCVVASEELVCCHINSWQIRLTSQTTFSLIKFYNNSRVIKGEVLQ